MVGSPWIKEIRSGLGITAYNQKILRCGYQRKWDGTREVIFDVDFLTRWDA
jgi:hypothetical protein